MKKLSLYIFLGLLLGGNAFSKDEASYHGVPMVHDNLFYMGVAYHDKPHKLLDMFEILIYGNNPEIIIDLGGDSKPEKIVYMRDTICEGSWMYCGSGGCSLEVFDDNGVKQKSYLVKNDWYIRPSETNPDSYENPTENAFELIIPMSQSYCSENHGKENCSRVIKVKNNQITESVE